MSNYKKSNAVQRCMQAGIIAANAPGLSAPWLVQRGGILILLTRLGCDVATSQVQRCYRGIGFTVRSNYACALIRFPPSVCADRPRLVMAGTSVTGNLQSWPSCQTLHPGSPAGPELHQSSQRVVA